MPVTEAQAGSSQKEKSSKRGNGRIRKFLAFVAPFVLELALVGQLFHGQRKCGCRRFLSGHRKNERPMASGQSFVVGLD
jgi:hypothetical protein